MHSKQVWSWALYDFANTAFSALFVTFFFPLYVKEYLGGNEFQIGIVFGGSMVLVGLCVPLLGVIADLTGRRVRLVGIFTALCVGATALVAWANLTLALILGFLANFFYHACLVSYNSILPQLTKQEHHGSVSGFGVGIGYLGTLASLALAGTILSTMGWENPLAIALIFPATALFFLVFALPLFWNVPDKVEQHKHNLTRLMRSAFTELRTTLRRINTYKGLLPFLLSAFSYANATTAAIIFLFLYARQQLQMGIQTFALIFAWFALASAIGSLLAGKLTDRIGPKQTLVLAGILWMLVLLVLLNPVGISTFLIAGALGGIGLGSIWTANRPMILHLAPRLKPGEFFGFNELAEKFSGSLGPIIFGWLVVDYGYTLALASLLVFFGVGLALLGFVPSTKE